MVRLDARKPVVAQSDSLAFLSDPRYGGGASRRLSLDGLSSFATPRQSVLSWESGCPI